jgi:hypothetical protein
MPIQKINVDLAMISNGRYERAASIDAIARFPPAFLTLFDMGGLEERERKSNGVPLKSKE